MLPGNNINLRPLRIADWGKTLQWRNDPDIKDLAMMHPYPVTELLEKEWYEELLKNKSNKVIYFAIADKDDSPLGYVFLNNINHIHRNCYLGIVIGDKTQRRKGYGTAAIKLLAQYAFNTLNMHKITVEVINKNPHALKVYEKLGFVNEGCMKQQFFSNGIYCDVLIMSLFANED
jgi:UDP-4-amino-4,6-dideoxy-N-acetyl-beta-L-altrosamine N-acetyltransferase